jgi:hypothetical protein
MQPTSTSCPICHPNDKRINFNGGPAGFTLEIFPGRKPSMHALRAHSLEDEDTPDVVNAELPITNEKADALDKSFEPIDVAVLDDTHSHADDDAAFVDANATCATCAACKSVRNDSLYQQVIPICNPADPLTTIEQLAFFHQGRATYRQLAAPSLSTYNAYPSFSRNRTVGVCEMREHE